MKSARYGFIVIFKAVCLYVYRMSIASQPLHEAEESAEWDAQVS